MRPLMGGETCNKIIFIYNNNYLIKMILYYNSKIQSFIFKMIYNFINKSNHNTIKAHHNYKPIQKS